MWGAAVENYFHRSMPKTNYELFRSLPVFKDYQHAFDFATTVDRANKSGRGVLIIDFFQNMSLDDMKRH